MALLIRVVSIVFDLPVRAAFALVLLVADVAALAALYLVPLPVIHLMGGISAEQETVALTALLVTGLCWAALPLLIGLAAAVVRSTPDRIVWRVPSTPERPAGVNAALAFAGLILIGWTALLPFTQPEHILARRVEQAYRRSGPAAALAMMSAHKRIDFPPDWQPPPRKFPGEPPISEVLTMLEAIAEKRPAAWIGDLYSRRFRDRVRFDPEWWPGELLTKHTVRLAAILTRLPEGPEMARALQHTFPSIDSLLERDRLGPDPNLSEDQRAALKTLFRLAGDGKVEPAPGPKAADPGEAAKPHE